MMNIRYEEYSYGTVPIYFNTNLIRTKHSAFPDMNWHESIEIQLCNAGTGTVYVDGNSFLMNSELFVVINSNSIHYTVTDDYLDYSALIISPDFCEKMGFDCNILNFNTVVKNEYVMSLLKKLQKIYTDKTIPYQAARETSLILQIMVELAQNHCGECVSLKNKGKSFAYVKSAINFIRDNFNTKIQLDDIARAVCVDKYFLSREFKKKTGKTIVEYINSYRCNQAVNLILSGLTVSEAASRCGFDNFSYFTKTFKRIVGTLPSKLDKKHKKKR